MNTENNVVWLDRYRIAFEHRKRVEKPNPAIKITLGQVIRFPWIKVYHKREHGA